MGNQKICVGMDIMNINEIDRLLTRDWFTKYIYSPEELRLCATWHKIRKYEFLTGRFCAKEAVYKALPSTHSSAIKLKPRQISIGRLPDNQPNVHIDFLNNHLKHPKISISITHKDNVCAAFALVQLDNSNSCTSQFQENNNGSF